MNDPALYIYLAAALGSLLGSLGTVAFATARRHRIERHTWNNARIFYTRLYADKTRSN